MSDPSPQTIDIAHRLAEWQQGDFAIDCGEFWFRDVEKLVEGTDETSDFGYDPEVSGFAVVTQTCDIVRPPELVAYVTICPLIKVSDQKVNELSKGISPRTCFLANLPKNTVLDLSRAMSVSKELLVTWDRKRGCTNTNEQLELARALEGVFGRFAFPDDFIASVSKFRRSVIEKYAKENSELGQAIRSISEFRIYPHAAWTDATLVPITFIAILDDLENREMKDRGKIFSILEGKLKDIIWKGVFAFADDKLLVQTMFDLSAADYVNSFPLELNSLSFARQFTVGAK